MNITVERTGGFTGGRRTVSVSDSDLALEDRDRLAALVEAADFFNLPEGLQSQMPGPDRFQFKVEINQSTGRHTVQADEMAASPELKELIKWVLAKAPRPKQEPK